jgi:hypothetical protein
VSKKLELIRGGYRAAKEDDLQDLFCQAQGCPRKWSVDAGSGRLCGAHAFADTDDWPRITEELQRSNFERQFERERVEQPEPAPKLTKEEKIEILNRLRKLVNGEAKDHRAWAKRLREREEAGEVLSLTQRKAWREALHVR